MDLVFFGTAQFAVPSLEALVKGPHPVRLCVTQPDRGKGRGRVVKPSAVKQSAARHGTRLVQPETLEDSDFLDQLGKVQADCFIVVAYGLKLTRKVLGLAKHGCVNIHASLLPRYRGAAPIQWAIARGEKETGISLIRMNEVIDAGSVLFQKKTAIGKEEDACELSRRLSLLAAEILPGFLNEWEGGKCAETPQDSRRVTPAPRLKKADGQIDWTRSALEVDRRVRGMQPWPSAFTSWKKRQVKILRGGCDASRGKGGPGTVLEAGAKGIVIACGEGAYFIKELQLESGRAMSAAAFLAGHPLKAGEKLG